jgi:hypothetical protein
MKVLDVVAWAVFFGSIPILWASGVVLFLRSSLSGMRKMGWTLFLVSVGIAIGYALSLSGIRNRFLVLLAGLPILAIIDVKLAKSSRRLSFWFRACSFEVTTVFGTAAATRLMIERVNSAP